MRQAGTYILTLVYIRPCDKYNYSEKRKVIYQKKKKTGFKKYMIIMFGFDNEYLFSTIQF